MAWIRVGIGLLGVITANVAAFFVTNGDAADRRRLDAMEQRLEHIEHLLEVVAQSLRIRGAQLGRGDRRAKRHRAVLA